MSSRQTLLTVIKAELKAGGLSVADLARDLVERLQKVAEDFARQHLSAQKLPATEQRQYTLVMGMRSWLFDQFRYLQRGSA